MKTNVILFLAALLFTTSCSNRFSLVKRKYNKGFYVSVNKKTNTPKSADRNATAQAISKDNNTHETVALETIPAKAAASTPAPATNIKPEAVASHKKATNAPITKQDQKTSVVTAAVNDQASFESAKTIKPVPAASKSQASDSDVHIVLLVILAILIPPLAVYLKHKTIDMWFWITLVLTVVGFGLVFGTAGFGGLLGLAAVVIALLYVFDVING